MYLCPCVYPLIHHVLVLMAKLESEPLLVYMYVYMSCLDVDGVVQVAWPHPSPHLFLLLLIGCAEVSLRHAFSLLKQSHVWLFVC